MFPISIDSVSGGYEISLGNLKGIILDCDFVIADSFFKSCEYLITKDVIFVEAKEENKSLKVVENIIYDLSLKGATKKSRILAMGGGLVQDLSTLAASLYMRGVEWSYLPTTLAAMGDSCIGGKSSINIFDIKNLAGNFYPPNRIHIDTSVISTLPQLELVAGYSEILKICFAHSEKSFIRCIEIICSEMISDEKFIELVSLSLECKKYFVEIDEFDRGVRKLLNFGHSFGHALESATNFQLPHGVAVLIGMLAAMKHPDSTKSDLTLELKRVCNYLLATLSSAELDCLQNIDFRIFNLAMLNDKKNSNRDLVLILPGSNGLEVRNFAFAEGALESAEIATRKAVEEVLDEIF